VSSTEQAEEDGTLQEGKGVKGVYPETGLVPGGWDWFHPSPRLGS